jgi:hypothetical protein
LYLSGSFSSHNMFRTMVHNVLVGSVSFASSGTKALHNTFTAQKITMITESASSFQFKVRKSHLASAVLNNYIPLLVME